MIVDKKIQAAEYHLANMKEKNVKDEQHFIYEVEAFLTKIRSIPDVLLEDYNQKFGLGISLNEKLYPKIFRDKANLVKDQKIRKKALDFLKWWIEEINRFSSNPLTSLFFKKRNKSIHRTELRVDLKRVTTQASINLSGSVTVIKRDKYGNIYDAGSFNDLPDKKENRQSKPSLAKNKIEDTKVEWCFSEYPNENILEACQTLLDTMKQYALDAKKKFT